MGVKARQYERENSVAGAGRGSQTLDKGEGKLPKSSEEEELRNKPCLRCDKRTKRKCKKGPLDRRQRDQYDLKTKSGCVSLGRGG